MYGKSFSLIEPLPFKREAVINMNLTTEGTTMKNCKE